MAVDEFRVLVQPGSTSVSRYRLIDAAGEEVEPVNEFLDATALRGLSGETLRTYAYALLSVWKWITEVALAIEDLTEPPLAEYIRHLRESGEGGKPAAPRSINLHLSVVRSLYRFQTGRELPRGVKAPVAPPPLFVQPSRVGTDSYRWLGRPWLRVKVPRRLVVPLTREQVYQFFESLRTYRDLAITALMLFCGLRSREVISLKLQDVDLLQEQIRVSGKGEKDRVLPLAPYVRRTVSAYLQIERPLTDHGMLFVNLKGRPRGKPMTRAGLRQLFRYHRKRSGIENANPHRFRHTFAVDMIREGMALPVLKRLLGHSNIEMTMRYVNLSAEDVRKEFERAVRRLTDGFADGEQLPKNP